MDDKNKQPNQEPLDPNSENSSENSVPRDVEMYEPSSTPGADNSNEQSKFTNDDIGFSQKGTDSNNARYEGPVSQSQYGNNEYSQSFNSTSSQVPKSHRRQWQILLLVLLIAVIGIAVWLLLPSDSSSPSQQLEVQDKPTSTQQEDVTLPVNESDANEAETTQEQPVEEPVEQPATPQQQDEERASDINNIHLQLEAFYTENAYYPSTIDIAQLNITSTDTVTDPDGNEIKVSVPRLSSTPADDPYQATTKPAGAQYTYSAYRCNSGVPGEAKCASYQIYGWLETDANGYDKISLN